MAAMMAAQGGKVSELDCRLRARLVSAGLDPAHSVGAGWWRAKPGGY